VTEGERTVGAMGASGRPRSERAPVNF